jgi:hypothetical protein
MSYPMAPRAMRELPGIEDSITQPIHRGYRILGSEQLVTTHRMRKSQLRIVVGRLVLPVVLLVTAGVAIGGYVVWSGEGVAETPLRPEHRAKPEAPDQVEPAPAGKVELAAPVPAVASTQALVDVRIDSMPSGAEVTLIDRGKHQFVGQTPVTVTVDASRSYDLVFTYPDQATAFEHLDAKTTRRVAVVQEPREKAPVPPRGRSIARSFAEQMLGEGTLMISSKPPCEIVIDGKPTGLTTPQRSISLPAGNHKVTLVNTEKDIQKTIGVQIAANATQKVIEDLMP